MSYSSYLKAMQTIKDMEEYEVGQPQTIQVIQKAEQLLGFELSPQNKNYFMEYGYVEFDGNEIYGIIKSDFSGYHEGNSVGYALSERVENNLPKKWLPIYFLDDGYMAYLDYSQLNIEGEPFVISAYYNGSNYVLEKKIADDFGDFLTKLINEDI